MFFFFPMIPHPPCLHLISSETYVNISVAPSLVDSPRLVLSPSPAPFRLYPLISQDLFEVSGFPLLLTHNLSCGPARTISVPCCSFSRDGFRLSTGLLTPVFMRPVMEDDPNMGGYFTLNLVWVFLFCCPHLVPPPLFFFLQTKRSNPYPFFPVTSPVFLSFLPRTTDSCLESLGGVIHLLVPTRL